MAPDPDELPPAVAETFAGAWTHEELDSPGPAVLASVLAGARVWPEGRPRTKRARPQESA